MRRCGSAKLHSNTRPLLKYSTCPAVWGIYQYEMQQRQTFTIQIAETSKADTAGKDTHIFVPKWRRLLCRIVVLCTCTSYLVHMCQVQVRGISCSYIVPTSTRYVVCTIHVLSTKYWVHHHSISMYYVLCTSYLVPLSTESLLVRE